MADLGITMREPLAPTEGTRVLSRPPGSLSCPGSLTLAVGISRQALYLHFPDRAQLLLALVAHTDEKEQPPAGIAAVTQAANGPAVSASH